MATRPYLASVWAAKELSWRASKQLKQERAAVLLPVLAAARRKHADILGTPFPKTLNDLARIIPTPLNDNLITELRWNANVLIAFSDQLLPLLANKQRFEEMILKADYSSAAESLSHVEETGQSWWLYSMRCLLEQKRGGLEANKIFSQKVRETTSSPWVQFLAHSLSQRAEEDMSAEEFEAYCDLLSASDEHSPRRKRSDQYFQFRLNFQNFKDFDFLPECLNIEESHGLLDRFVTFGRVMQSYMINRNLAVGDDLLNVLGQYCRAIPSSQLSVLWNLSQPENASATTVDSLVFEILHHYTIGDYRTSLKISLENISSHVGTFELYELAAKSALRLKAELPSPFEDQSTAGSILQATYHVLARNSRKREAVRYLHRLSHQLDSFPIADQLYSFYKRYEDDRTALRSDRSSLLGAAVATPKLAPLIGTTEGPKLFLSSLKPKYPGNAAVKLFLATHNALQSNVAFPIVSDLPESRTVKYRAYVLESQKRFAEALVAYEQLEMMAEDNPLLRSDAITGVYRCHLSLGNFFQCATVLADAAVLNPDLVTHSTVREVLDRYATSRTKDWQHNIAWPLLYYIGNRDGILKISPEAMHDVFDDFLGTYELQKPSQLRGINTGIPAHLLVFLLRYVCIVDVLDSSIWYDTQEEVETERMAICAWLTELDPENRAEYTAGIAEIVARVKTRDLTHHVGHNKIFVDTDGIRSSLPEGFSDRILRCMALAQLTVKLRDGIAVVNAPTAGAKNVDVVATDEGFRTFKSLFNDILQYFTFSNEYGLDANLSQSIRHGALLGELRAQFDPFHLLTEQSEGRYAENDYWLSRLKPLPTSRSKTVEILQVLSKGVDTLAKNVRDQWIQIKSPGNAGIGMFDYDFPDSVLGQLYLKISAVGSVDGFIDFVFEVLWQKTVESLERVRSNITSDLRSQLFELLDTSLFTLSQLTPESELSEYRASITSLKNQLEHGLQSMAEWFHIDQAQKIPPFRLSELLDALLEQVGKYCGPARLIMNKQMRSNSLVDGRLFRPFWDLLFILFDNAAKYANCSPASLRIEIDQEPAQIVLVISNETGSVVDRTELCERAALATAAAQVARPNELFRREGRSGFPKIGKILRYDFGCEEQDVKVSVDENKWFCVTVVMKAHGIYAENTPD